MNWINNSISAATSNIGQFKDGGNSFSVNGGADSTTITDTNTGENWTIGSSGNFEETGLTPGTTYTYQAITTADYSNDGEGPDQSSSAADASATTDSMPAPEAPGISAAAISSTAIDVTISDASDYTDITRSCNGQAEGWMTLEDGQTTWHDTGLSPGTTYTYSATTYTAYSDEDEGSDVGSPSAEAQATTGPKAPIVTATAASDSAIDISVSDAAASTTISRSTNDVDFTPIDTQGSDSFTYRDNGLMPSTHYYYQVVTTDDISNLSSEPGTAEASTLAPPILNVQEQADAQAGGGPDGDFCFSLTNANGSAYTATSALTFTVSYSGTATTDPNCNYTGAATSLTIGADESSVDETIHAEPDATGNPIVTTSGGAVSNPPPACTAPQQKTLIATPDKSSSSDSSSSYTTGDDSSATMFINPVTISELDVTDVNQNSNTIAATGNQPADLYVSLITSGKYAGEAEIKLSSSVDPSGAQLVYNVQGDGVTRVPGSPATAPQFYLNPAEGTTTSDYLVTAAPVDNSGSGGGSGSSGSTPTLPVQQEVVVHFVNYLDVQTMHNQAADGSLDRTQKNSPGAYLPLDNNDWNYSLDASGNLILDMNQLDSSGQPMPDPSDKYLLPVKLHALPNVTESQYMVNVVGSGLRIWDGGSGAWSTTLVEPASQDTTIYVEGIARGSAASGAPSLTLDLTYQGTTTRMDQGTFNVFEMDGALNVPGGGSYVYSVADQIPGATWAQPDGGTPTGASAQQETVTWANAAQVGYVKYQPDSAYTWSCGVNVVSVTATRLAPDPYPGVPTYLPIAPLTVDSAPSGENATILSIGFTLTGPLPNANGIGRGVTFIKVGIVQNAKTTYKEEKLPDGDIMYNAAQDGCWYLDNSGGTYPYYDTDAASNENNSNNRILQVADHPADSIYSGDGTVKLMIDYRDFLVARTTDPNACNGGSPAGNPYNFNVLKEASWEFNGSGVVSSQTVYIATPDGPEPSTLYSYTFDNPNASTSGSAYFGAATDTPVFDGETATDQANRLNTWLKGQSF